jgi:hypothetical protein
MGSLLSPLLTIANYIICLVEKFFYMVADGIIWAVNQLIIGVALAIAVVVAIMPNMPTLPALPSEFVTAEGWVAWFWPVNTTIDIITFMITAWLVWLGVATILRWARAIGA